MGKWTSIWDALNNCLAKSKIRKWPSMSTHMHRMHRRMHLCVSFIIHWALTLIYSVVCLSVRSDFKLKIYEIHWNEFIETNSNQLTRGCFSKLVIHIWYWVGLYKSVWRQITGVIWWCVSTPFRDDIEIQIEYVCKYGSNSNKSVSS